MGRRRSLEPSYIQTKGPLTPTAKTSPLLKNFKPGAIWTRLSAEGGGVETFTTWFAIPDI